jgi:hypothetical protein
MMWVLIRLRNVTFIVFSIVPYACCVSRMCCVYVDFGLFDLIACVCSLYLVWNFLPICPTYLSWQLLHFIWYMPLLLYRVSQEECARLREGVPDGKVYRYNPKHLCPKLNGYGDNGQRKVWYSSVPMHYRYQLTCLISVCPWVWCHFASHQLWMRRQECDVRVCQSTVVGNPKATSTSFFVAEFNGFMSLTS